MTVVMVPVYDEHTPDGRDIQSREVLICQTGIKWKQILFKIDDSQLEHWW